MDDKIVLRAVETGEDCRALGTRSARERAEALEAVDVQPQASWWIHEIEDLIQRLLARGHAYVGRDGAIWFNVASLEDYGSLARQAGQDMDSAASKLNLTIDDESTAKALA